MPEETSSFTPMPEARKNFILVSERKELIALSLTCSTHQDVSYEGVKPHLFLGCCERRKSS